MTARKTSQQCEISSHYTCSDTNCNPIQLNNVPINGTACLKQSMSFKRSNGRRAVIVRTFLSLAIAILLVLAAVFLTACGRGAGEFPNIPEVMDECGSWSEEEFASKMNLEVNTELSGGSKAVTPQWAKDLSSKVNGATVAMFLHDGSYKYPNTFEIKIITDFPQTNYDIGSELKAMEEREHYDFDFEDAIELLSLVGIKKSSIKVYDDDSSYERQASGYQGAALYTWDKVYCLCGEAETESGDPLWFSVKTDTGVNADTRSQETKPFDSVRMLFSTSQPFSVSTKPFE